ncbi:polysaccharide pyruvyl transferase family protein [Clostridium saccharoperbutylacetonicum]|uniref:polysaccharide pyruvyl transferase family protein n=1 Tax=Clostridium saccharoperbutylacetonicum TaxID=36745 RepID=UPI000983CD10|nr:polysaccharide pyruvyl transferase family protein [Clostridium saccharoperbutylacetonicum]AQR97824.1 polysaccharide pyruvyl transferase [Clostridium saccharoperbutylacetonicum]NSB33714.1 hypothetical protein [Clostridium saccharoperbutylacetonicum]
MKTGIITFHFVNNFGGALQAYALSEIVSDLNKEKAMIIDYRNSFIRFTDFVRIFPISTNVREVIAGMLTFRQRIGRVKKFKKFGEDYFKTSMLYTSKNKLEKYPPTCNKFICGSDQIWNPVITLGVCSPYYLDFIKDSNKKISYAASFGITKINKKHWEIIAKYLKQFRAISVREKEGMNIVKEIIGKNAECLIDPTFLLSKEQWLKIAEYPISKEPYILVYMMQNNEKIYEYARKIKEILNIKVVAISRYGLKEDFIDEIYIDIGPREFVGLFQNASYICTNSFHGLAFSLIFEKKFFLLPSTRFNSRIENLLEVLKLELIKDITKDTIENGTYNKEVVRKIISKEREKAISFLKENLEL